LDLVHEGRQRVSSRDLKKQMEMIRHQTIMVEFDRVF